MRAGVPGGNSRSITGFATYCGSPSVRMGVHPEPGRRVDLDDAAAGLADGGLDVGADEVDAGDVEPDDAGRRLGDLDVVRVGLHRPVDRGAAGRHVAGEGELDEPALLGDVVGLQALALEDLLGVGVELDPRQDLLVADASPRVRVGHVDELADGAGAVAGDAGGDPLGDRRELAADHEHPVVLAVQVGLHDDVAGPALPPRLGPGGADGVLVLEVQRDAPAVVAVERLDHAREPEALCGRDGVVLGLHHLAPRNGEPGTVEESVGQLLVGRDVDGDAAGPAGHRRADALLVDALAELDEAEPVEADVRDVAPGRLVEQRLGGRARTRAAPRAGSGPRAPGRGRRRPSRRWGRRGGSRARRPSCPPRARPAPRGTRRSRCTGRTRRCCGSCRVARRCRRGSGTRGRCARRRGRARSPP